MEVDDATPPADDDESANRDFSRALKWFDLNVSESDKKQARQGEGIIEAERKRTLQNDGIEAENKGKLLDNRLREKFSYLIFSLLAFWLVSVMTVIVLQGLNLLFCTTSIVITTLLGSSTAGITGIFWLVARYIFPNRDKHNNNKD